MAHSICAIALTGFCCSSTGCTRHRGPSSRTRWRCRGSGRRLRKSWGRRQPAQNGWVFTLSRFCLDLKVRYGSNLVYSSLSHSKFQVLRPIHTKNDNDNNNNSYKYVVLKIVLTSVDDGNYDNNDREERYCWDDLAKRLFTEHYHSAVWMLMSLWL